MEIRQIKRVLLHLAQGVSGWFAITGFELKHKDHVAGKQDRVDVALSPRNRELKGKAPTLVGNIS